MLSQQTPEIAAKRVLDSLWDGLLPVNIHKISGDYGVRVEYTPMFSESGVVSIESGKPIIRVNSTETERRQRFTVAHELGHIVLHHLTEEKPEFRDPTQNYTLANYDVRERDANRFAATILMPPEVVRSILNSEGITNVDVLADRFGVSTAAMTIRLKTMGILPEWA